MSASHLYAGTNEQDPRTILTGFEAHRLQQIARRLVLACALRCELPEDACARARWIARLFEELIYSHGIIGLSEHKLEAAREHVIASGHEFLTIALLEPAGADLRCDLQPAPRGNRSSARKPFNRS